MPIEIAGAAPSPLFTIVPGMPLLHDGAESGLGMLAGQGGVDYPPLQGPDALSNANGAPALPRFYAGPADPLREAADPHVLFAVIDQLKTTTTFAQMDSAKASMKDRIEAKEAWQRNMEAKRKEEQDHQAQARKKSLSARIFGLVAQVVSTIALGIALAAAVVSGVGLFASPILLAMFAASVMGVVEKSVQLAGNENFSMTGTLCSVVTAGLKTLGMERDLAEKVGNVIGSAVMVATVVGLINDPSAVGRLWGNAAQLAGVPKSIAENIEMGMSLVATVGVMAFSFWNAAGSLGAAGGTRELIALLSGSVALQTVGILADITGNAVSGVASVVGGGANSWATWDTYQADKVGAECYELQNEIKMSDGWNSMEAEILRRASASYSEWRENFTRLTQVLSDSLERMTASGGAHG